MLQFRIPFSPDTIVGMSQEAEKFEEFVQTRGYTDTVLFRTGFHPRGPVDSRPATPRLVVPKFYAYTGSMDFTALRTNKGTQSIRKAMRYTGSSFHCI